MNKDLRLGGIAARLAGNIPVISRKGMIWLKDKIHFKLTYRHLIDGIIVPSQSLKEQLQMHTWLQNEINVIPVGLDPLEFRPNYNEYRQYILSRYNLDKDTFIIGTASRLAEHKGHQDLLPAMANIFRDYPKTKLLMVGTGVDKAMIEEVGRRHNILDRIIFAGYIGDRQEIIRHMGAYDIFVLPSHKEPFGQVLIETMSLERPIVACGVDGIPGVVEDGVTADLVPPHSPQALDKAIRSFIESPQKREQYGKAGRKRVEEHFTIDRMIDRIEKYFLKKIAPKRGH